MSANTSDVARSGDYVVIQGGAPRFPDICIWCGAVPLAEMTPVTLSELSGGQTLEITRTVMRLPVCGGCHAKSKRRGGIALWICGVLAAISISLMVALGMFDFQPDNKIAIGLAVASVVIGLVAIFGLAAALMLRFASKQRSVAIINDEYIWMRDVSATFLAALPEWRGKVPLLLARRVHQPAARAREE